MKRIISAALVFALTLLLFVPLGISAATPVKFVATSVTFSGSTFAVKGTVTQDGEPVSGTGSAIFYAENGRQIGMKSFKYTDGVVDFSITNPDFAEETVFSYKLQFGFGSSAPVFEGTVDTSKEDNTPEVQPDKTKAAYNVEAVISVADGTLVVTGKSVAAKLELELFSGEERIAMVSAVVTDGAFTANFRYAFENGKGYEIVISPIAASLEPITIIASEEGQASVITLDAPADAALTYKYVVSDRKLTVSGELAFSATPKFAYVVNAGEVDTAAATLKVGDTVIPFNGAKTLTVEQAQDAAAKIITIVVDLDGDAKAYAPAVYLVDFSAVTVAVDATIAVNEQIAVAAAEDATREEILAAAEAYEALTEEEKARIAPETVAALEAAKTAVADATYTMTAEATSTVIMGKKIAKITLDAGLARTGEGIMAAVIYENAAGEQMIQVSVVTGNTVLVTEPNEGYTVSSVYIYDSVADTYIGELVGADISFGG